MRWHTLEQATEIKPPRNACVCGLQGFLTWKGFLYILNEKFQVQNPAVCICDKGRVGFFFFFSLHVQKLFLYENLKKERTKRLMLEELK